MNPDSMLGLETVLDKVKMNLQGDSGGSLSLEIQKRIYRELSTVIFFTVSIGEENQKLILKKCKPSKWDLAAGVRSVEIEYQTLKRLYEGFSEFDGFNVPKPILVSPEHEMLVMEAYDIPPILEQMKCLRYLSSRLEFENLQNKCMKVGLWLKHLWKVSHRENANVNILSGLENECRQRVQEIGKSSMELVPVGFYSEMTAQLEQMMNMVSKSSLAVCGVHGDFAPQNILCSEDRLIVIDLFSYHEGIVCFDAIDFLLFLDIRKNSPVQSSKRINLLINAFWQGYGDKYELSEVQSDLSEFYHRIRNLHQMVFPEPGVQWNRPFIRNAIIKSHIRWLYGGTERKNLW